MKTEEYDSYMKNDPMLRTVEICKWKKIKNKDIKENIKVEAIDGKYCQWRSMKFVKVKHTRS